MVPNFLYSNSFHFSNIVIIIIISNKAIISDKATEPTIFQYFQAKFDQNSFL